MNIAETTLITYVPFDTQVQLFEQVKAIKAASPFVQPRTPGGAPMRVRVTSAGRLGWVGDGAYRYSETDSRGSPWPPIPDLWTEIANLAIAGCERYEGSEREDGGPLKWDSAIVNWYAPDASLGWHQDLSERDRTLPIVTISLGDTASWAVKESESGPASRVRLESGAVTVLAGDLRLAFHSIERIIPNEMFSPLGATRGRISITLRVAG